MATTTSHPVGRGIYNLTILPSKLVSESLNSSTYDDHASSLTATGDIFAGMHLALVSVLTTVGNFLIIILAKKNCRTFKPIDKLIINIAVSDILTGFFGYPLPMLSSFRHRWNFGTSGCVWYSFLSFTSGTVSMVSIGFVALFRYIIISQSNAESQTLFSRRVSYAVVFSWIYALMWSCFPLIGWGSYSLEPFRTACSVDWVSTRLTDKSFVGSIMVMVLVVPLILTVSCYIAIARRLHRHKVQLRQRGHRGNSTFMQFRRETRLIVTALAVTCCFVISWVPYALASILLSFIGVQTKGFSSLSFFPAMFAKTSTVYNPIIYFIFNKKFRTEAIKLVCRCGCKMFHYNLNIKEEWYADHSGGMRIIVTGRRVDYRVVFDRPIFRQVRKNDREEMIPMRNLREVSIKQNIWDDTPHNVMSTEKHIKGAEVSSHLTSRSEVCVGGAEARTTVMFSSSALWSDDLPGQVSYTSEERNVKRKKTCSYAAVTEEEAEERE